MVALGWLADIGDARQDVPREIGAGGLPFDFRDIRVDVAYGDHVVTLACEAERHHPAETAQSAGDDRDPSFHRSLLWCPARSPVYLNSRKIRPNPRSPMFQKAAHHRFGLQQDRLRIGRVRRRTPTEAGQQVGTPGPTARLTATTGERVSSSNPS